GEQTEAPVPTAGWRQQQAVGAGHVLEPQSASGQSRTAGQSPRLLRRRSQPGIWGCRGNGYARPPAYRPGLATGVAPGPHMWTSPDQGSVRSPWSLVEQGRWRHAAHQRALGQSSPRACP
ncbi:hypothetical protein PO909_023133, partial [Leuciscus waleckii]